MGALRTRVFPVFLILWVSLWLIFVIHENKPGQFKELFYLYAHSDYNDKVSYILGKDFYDFILFCKDAVPEGSTYDIAGFSYSDLKEVQAKYHLWPRKVDTVFPDFKIYYKTPLQSVEGYSFFRKLGADNFILIKKGQE